MRSIYRLFLFFTAFYLTGGFATAQNNNRPNVILPNDFAVNSYTGNLYHNRRDIKIPGQGLNIDINFSYNASQRTKNRGFGKGWTFAYNVAYTVEASGIWIEREDGKRDFFTKSGTQYVSPVGVYDTLTEYTAGKFSLSTKDGWKYFFDNAAHKRLTKWADRNANTLTLTYTDSLISSLSDGAGHTLNFTWGSGLLASITDNSCAPTRVFSYAYDTAKNLIKVINPLNDSVLYRYDNAGRIVRFIDRNNYGMSLFYNPSSSVKRVVSCVTTHAFTYVTSQYKTFVTEKVNGRNVVTTYQYDTLGRIINKKGNCCGFDLSYKYDANNNIIEQTDGNNTVTFFQYDAKGNISKAIDAAGQSISYAYEPAYSKVTSLKDKNGNTTSFIYDASGNLKQANKPLSITEKFTYDSKGNITGYTDGNNNVSGYEYNSSGYLTKATNAENGITLYTYDCHGNRLTETDARNNTTTYLYNALDQLVKATDALGNVTSFSYDKTGNLTSTTNALGKTTTYSYDGLNRLIATTTPLGITRSTVYDEQGNVIRTFDGNGNTKSYTYNNRRQVLTETDALGNTKSYNYDNAGNLISVTDRKGNTTSYEYDAVYRVKKITNALGNSVRYSYDANGNRTVFIDANGNATAYEYDALNRLNKVTDALNKSALFTLDANGNRLTEKDRNGNTTAYEFDKLNRTKKKTDALGNVTLYGYDANGNITSTTDALNNVVAMRYDALDRLLSRKNAVGDSVLYSYDGVDNILTAKQPNNNVITFAYDFDNRLKSQADNIGTFALYSYDNTGNIISEADALNQLTTYQYDAEDRRIKTTFPNNTRQQFFYDKNGNKIKEVNQKGYATQFEYDELNRAIKLVDAMNNASRFVYDPNGSLTNIIDAKGNTTSYNYDALKRLTRQVYPDGSTRQYTYDGNGLPLTRTDNKGILTQYRYDRLNRLTARLYPGSLKDSLRYDAIGRLVSAINADATITMAYDAAGRLTNETLNGRSTAYVHNTAAKTKQITYPGGMQVLWQMDARERLTQITESATALASFQYDGNDRVIAKQYRNNTSHTYAYDNVGNLTTIGSTPVNILRLNYSYDSAANRLATERLHRPTASEKYTYDSLDQVKTFAKGQYSGVNFTPSATHSYAYDELGNRTSSVEDTKSRTYTANNLNQYKDIVTNSINAPPSYDKNGNLLSDGSNVYSYDYENRLTSAQAGTNTTGYKYDALGRRIARTVGATETTYAYDALNLIEEKTGTTTKAYAYGDNLDDILFAKSGTSSYYYHTDDLNSVHTLTDQTGVLAEYYNYDAFGLPHVFNPSNTELTTSALNNILFTGRTYEYQQKIYHYRNREMNPQLGRFLQRDPLEFVDGLNTYSYVNNSTINYPDPLGLVNWKGVENSIYGISLNLITAGIGIGMSETGIGAFMGVPLAQASAYQLAKNIKNLNNALNDKSPEPNEKNSFCEMVSPFDPLLTLYLHHQIGGKDELIINAATLDFSNTSQRKLGLHNLQIGELESVNLIKKSGYNVNSLAFGKIDFKYVGNNQFEISSNPFDFNFEPGGFTERNILNAVALAINYFPNPLIPLFYGGDYNVKFTGKVYIPE